MVDQELPKLPELPRPGSEPNGRGRSQERVGKFGARLKDMASKLHGVPYIGEYLGEYFDGVAEQYDALSVLATGANAAGDVFEKPTDRLVEAAKKAGKASQHRLVFLVKTLQGLGPYIAVLKPEIQPAVDASSVVDVSKSKPGEPRIELDTKKTVDHLPAIINKVIGFIPTKMRQTDMVQGLTGLADMVNGLDDNAKQQVAELIKKVMAQKLSDEEKMSSQKMIFGLLTLLKIKGDEVQAQAQA